MASRLKQCYSESTSPHQFGFRNTVYAWTHVQNSLSGSNAKYVIFPDFEGAIDFLFRHGIQCFGLEGCPTWLSYGS